MKKEMVVRQGVLDPIVRLSFNTRSSARNIEKSHDHSFAARPLNEEETVRLQALHVISSVALGEDEFHFPEHLSTANNVFTRRAFLPRLLAIILCAAGDPVESLPVEQSLSTSPGFTSSFVKSCRRLGPSIQHKFSQHKLYRGRNLFQTTHRLLVPDTISDLCFLIHTKSGLACCKFNQSRLPRRTPPAKSCKFGSS